MKLRPVFLYICIVFTATYSAAAVPAPAQAGTRLGVDRVENKVIYFKAMASGDMATPKSAAPWTPPPLKTELYELNYLGAINSKNAKLPFFLFTGKPCQDCLDDKTIYAIKPTQGKAASFVYPGKILDPKTRALLLESRAFYGKCLPNRGEMYIAFQRERVDRRSQLQASVYIAEATDDSLTESLIERHLPKIQTTLNLVKHKSCFEISGRNRLMLAKPLDLNPRSPSSESDLDDRDEEPAEGATESAEATAP